MNLPDLKSAPARVLDRAKNLSEPKCVKLIIALDVILGCLFCYIGGEILSYVQGAVRWSGLLVLLGGFVLNLRAWSLLSRYIEAVSGIEPWWSFERAVDRVR